MSSDPPGWYHDPKRPGIRRYWDGDHWIDVDQLVDENADPPAQRRSSGAFRLVTQRRPDDEAGLEAPPAPGEPEPHQD